MPETKRRRAEELFQQAADLPDGQRGAFLDKECGDDADLKARVSVLLARLKAKTDSFLERSPFAQEAQDLDVAEPLPDSIAGYEIVRRIDSGGQGVLYEALQKSTKRHVAIKVLLGGAFASKLVRHRFQREIELVASLEHPNIISIFHSGETTDGQPFFVMDYVRGVPFQEHVRERKLALEEALTLFATVCAAVNYAHQRGVMHRDLKPSNILVDSDGAAKVLDFGLAKTVGGPRQTMTTMTGQVLGTLPYMSPEQARGNVAEIDIRSDVYALGVILYEMLTGGYPYPVVGQASDVLRHIMQTPPTPPARQWRADSGITRRSSGRSRPGACPINGELQTIVLKALSKERERRYQTAGELARDVGHYLAGEPIEAKRASIWYVLSKLLRKYSARAAIAGAFILIVTAGVLLAVELRQALMTHAEKMDEMQSEVDGHQEALDKEYRESLTESHKLAEANVLAGRYKVAEEIFRTTLKRRKAMLGRDHPHTVETLKALIDLYRKWEGHDEQAVARSAELQKIKQQLLDSTPPGLGQRHKSSLRPKANYDLSEMNLYCELLVEAAEELWPPGDWRTALHRRDWGTCLLDLGKYAEAEPKLRAGYQGLLAANGADHMSTQNAITRLVELYDREHWDRPAESAKWRARLAAASEKPSGPLREDGDDTRP